MSEYNTIQWYVGKLKPYLPKEIFKPVWSRLLGGIVYLGLIIGGILAIKAFDLPIWGNLIIAILIGSSFASLGLLGHEILHGTVIRNRLIKEILGGIAFFPYNIGPRLWVKWHNATHHANTQHPEKDPDAFATFEQLLEKRFFRKLYVFPHKFRAIFSYIALSLTFTVHGTLMFFRFINEFKARERRIVYLQLILPWVTWISLLFWLGPVKWIFAYFIPLLIGNTIIMGYIATNHRLNPLTTINDPLANSLSVTVPKWVDIIHFNFSYHTEHHLLPGVNPKYYPLVKEFILEHWPERYNELKMSKALKGLYVTPRIYYNLKELIDPKKLELYPSLGNGLAVDNVKIVTNKV
ncbi:MAG: fatty acid desaturase family protein [Clostridium sp.]